MNQLRGGFRAWLLAIGLLLTIGVLGCGSGSSNGSVGYSVPDQEAIAYMKDHKRALDEALVMYDDYMNELGEITYEGDARAIEAIFRAWNERGLASIGTAVEAFRAPDGEHASVRETVPLFREYASEVAALYRMTDSFVSAYFSANASSASAWDRRMTELVEQADKTLAAGRSFERALEKL